MGLGPSRGSLLLIPSHLLPIPLCGLPLRSVRGGRGGKDDPAHREVCGLVRPLPNPQKDDDSDGKGAVTSWDTRPVSLLYLCMHTASAAKGKERQSLEGIAERRSMRPNKGGQRGKGQEVLGCGCRQGIFRWNCVPGRGKGGGVRAQVARGGGFQFLSWKTEGGGGLI